MAMTAKEKAAAQKRIAQIQAGIAKQKATLASLEAGKAGIAEIKTQIAASKLENVTNKEAIATNIGGTYNAVTGNIVPPTPKATTARAVLESIVRSAGIPANLVNQSVSFFESLDNDGIAVDAMLDIFMNNRSFTTKAGAVLESPFYKQFTSLGEGSIDPTTGKSYSAKDLMAWRLGIEQKVGQYGVSSKYTTDDILKKLLKNNVSPEKFEQNIQDARLATTAADPARIAALRAMGYINSSQDLTDFYMNQEIGQQQLEDNKRIGAFATEAIRAGAMGVKFDKARIEQVAAAYGNLTESAAVSTANTLYQGVAQNLNPTISLSGIYERTGKTASEMATPLQTELENEIITAMPSERRKRLAEQGTNAFKSRSGTYITDGGNQSLGGSNSLAGQI